MPQKFGIKIIISVLLGLNFTSHLYDHAFKYSKSVLIDVCKFSSLCAIWPIQVSSAKAMIVSGQTILMYLLKELPINLKLKYRLKRDYLEQIYLVFMNCFYLNFF
jgi:hypothetical protein